MQKVLIFILLITKALTISAQINTDQMMIIARNALYYDDYALSIQYFNQIISAKPYLYEPYFFRGLAKFYLEDFYGAESDCSQAIDLNPYYGNSYEVRGLSRINLKDYIGAASDYEKAVEIRNDSKNLWHNLILCYLEVDSLNKAETAVERLIKKWPNHADGYLFKAEILIKRSDTIAAEKSVDEALNVEKYSIQANAMKAGLLMNREEYATAETYLDEAIRLQPKNAGNFINRALCRYQQNNLRGAMSDYDLALDIEPNNFIGHYNRGLLRAAVGEDNKAIEDFNFILNIDPNDIMTLFNRALLLDQTGDYEGAIRDYTKVITQFPKFLYGYQLRAAARRKIGDSKGAMKDEEHVLRESVAHRYGYSTPTNRQKNKTRKKSDIDPNDYQQLVEEDDARVYQDEFRGKIQNKVADTKLMPVIVLANDGQTASQSILNDYTLAAYNLSQESLDSFKKGIEYSMEADKIRLNADKTALDIESKTEVYAMQKSATANTLSNGTAKGAYAKASESFAACIASAPQFAEAYYNLAYTQAMQGNYNAAINNLNSAIQKKPSFALAYFNRGIIRLFNGDRKEAFSDLSKAGELGIYQAYSIIKHNRQ